MINITLEDFKGDYVELINNSPVKPVTVRFHKRAQVLELTFSEVTEELETYIEENNQ